MYVNGTGSKLIVKYLNDNHILSPSGYRKTGIIQDEKAKFKWNETTLCNMLKNEVKQKINEFHEADVADDIIIFGNPCTMQIILSHFAEIKLTSQSKSVNAKYIKELTGIQNYKATDKQRKELFSKIKRENYDVMKENVKNLSTNDEELSSTNILKFIEKFESDDDSWIDEINEKL